MGSCWVRVSYNNIFCLNYCTYNTKQSVCLNAREKHNVPTTYIRILCFVVFMVRIVFGLKSHIGAACLLQFKVADKS